jgi:hypothetical protein
MKWYSEQQKVAYNTKPYKIAFPLFIVIFLLCLAIVVTDTDAEQQPGEYEVKAAFIYNFPQFVTWPPNAMGTNINICVIGDDPFGTALDATEEQTLGNKKMVISRLREPKHLKECHILFISKTEKKRLSQIFNTLKGTSTLIVGDTEGFAKQGVIINFYLVDYKVRLEINEDAARQSNLKISSKLLKLSRIVQNADR